MKFSKKIAVFALSVGMAVGGIFGLTACTPEDDTTDNLDPGIRAVYTLYAEAAEANGEQPMSYEEWYADLLANAKGEKGDKGDKGEPGEAGAQGEKGDKGDKGETGEAGAQGEKGDKGDTGAQGEKGDKGDTGETGAQGPQGEAGKDGNTWLVGEAAPTAEDGKDGDLYLDYATWNVYYKVNGEWQLLGNIKGADGVSGGEQQPDDSVKNFGEVTIEASGTYMLDLSDVAPGTYYLVAETETAVTNGVLSSKPNDKGYAYDMYSPAFGEFRSVVIVNDGTTDATLSNASGSAITANVRLEEYNLVIKANTEIDVPVTAFDTWIGVDLDEELIGHKVRITFSNWTGMVPTSICGIRTSGEAITGNSLATVMGVTTVEVDIPDNLTALWFPGMVTIDNRNVTVKFEVIG